MPFTATPSQAAAIKSETGNNAFVGVPATMLQEVSNLLFTTVPHGIVDLTDVALSTLNAITPVISGPMLAALVQQIPGLYILLNITPQGRAAYAAATASQPISYSNHPVGYQAIAPEYAAQAQDALTIFSFNLSKKRRH
jgi:hypothetical protein